MLNTYLKQLFGAQAQFRVGQQEAIQSVLNSKRTLVVQKTGWGKSVVYFLATKILRDQHKGITIIISPLLSLINNQIQLAEKLNLKAISIHSSNADNWSLINHSIFNNQYDILFITPERLANQDFITNVLSKIKNSIGMFVVDEAHCISDWGHDFRPDYKRIVNIIKFLPSNVPVLATTATANDRVIEDIKHQLGDNIEILRGDLHRESIQIQVIKSFSQTKRYAWMAEYIPKIQGTGIIYCLTIQDCDFLAHWLNQNGIIAESYHSKFSADERAIKESKLLNNQIKVMIATVALGMGFDKPDISFIIHFQIPSNVVAYYQQIGRAGRALKQAYAILFDGEESKEISEYFINNAFPTELEMQDVIEVLAKSNGLTSPQILTKINIKAGRLEKCLKYLEVEGAIYKDKKYYKSPKNWHPNIEHSERITQIRYDELNTMKNYINLDNNCYMEFLSNELDDKYAKPCGKCQNCLHQNLISTEIQDDLLIKAIYYLKRNHLILEPRKQFPTNIKLNNSSKINPPYLMQEGIILSSYGDAGWGSIVKEDKYTHQRFSDKLINASVEILMPKLKEWKITAIASIPSFRHPTLVKNFAQSVANQLGLKYLDILSKIKDTPPQKSFENSYFQCLNAMNSFAVTQNCHHERILLIDDMVDSRWTLTICSYRLAERGAIAVYPFVLAKTTSQADGD